MSNKVPDLPILLVDDEGQACKFYKTALETAFINNVIDCQDSREVMSLLSREKVGVIVLDILMPHLSGKELLPQIISEFPDIPVIMLTAVDEVETAVECMRDGASDYIVKPVEKDYLLSSIRRAVEMRELKEENSSMRRHFISGKLDYPEAFAEIITNNSAMNSIFQYIESIATTSRPVLITGETGTGKELIAQTIHKLSGRKGALIPVNAGGLDDNVFSDTLFGHKKGAYTSADEARRGLIDQASGGTLFLDEIGDLEPASQVKLLRLLQEGEYYPLGSDVRRFTDARIVVSTNSDLQNLIEKGQFRKDLYYRLRDHQIELPPLRDRIDDLPALAEHFFGRAASDLGKDKPFVPKELINTLSSYHFPGNIRELQGMIHDALGRHKKGTLSLESFKFTIDKEVGGLLKARDFNTASSIRENETDMIDLTKLLGTQFLPIKEVEALLIKEAMKRANGNQSVASRMLGLSRPTLNKRLKKLDNTPS